MNVKIGNKLLGSGESCYITFEPSSTYTNFEEANKFVTKSYHNGWKIPV